MMPVVRINDATFSDLSTLKTWFGTKTPSDTIDRIVRDALDNLGMERDDESDIAPVTESNGPMEFQSAPGLTFTKLLSATVNGKHLNNPRWSALLLAAIAQLKAKGYEGERLIRELTVPAKAIRFEDEGYKYISDLGISVQGQSAADAWKEVNRLASKWSFPVSIEFLWRQNPKAQYPGRTGRLNAGGS
jgi:hypothetical protein